MTRRPITIKIGASSAFRAGLVFLICALFSACRTTNDGGIASVANSASGDTGAVEGAWSEAPALEDAFRHECPPPETVCSGASTPFACTAKSYNGRDLPPSKELMSWGDSSCSARQALQRDACAKGLAPSRIGRIACIPDPSEGACPPLEIECPEGDDPMICVARSYGEQKLTDAQAVRAFGMNQCLALEALKVAGCRQNLDPTKFSEMTCERNDLEGECPLPKAAPCTDPPRPALCRVFKVLGDALPKPLVATASSACLAKRELMAMACKAGIRPSQLDDLVCEFSK